MLKWLQFIWDWIIFGYHLNCLAPRRTQRSRKKKRFTAFAKGQAVPLSFVKAEM